jgi:tripartite-type tricarboxylate transporter receptor subunit TctC
VPYKGLGQAVSAVVAGEARLTWAGVYSTEAHVKAGRLHAIAIAAPRRSPFLPDVPTFAELGFPAIDYVPWFGLFARAATPREVVDRVQRDVAHALATPEVRDKELLAKGYEPGSLPTDAFAAHIGRELSERAELVKASGARLD